MKRLTALVMAFAAVFMLTLCSPASAVSYREETLSGERLKNASAVSVKLSATVYEYSGAVITPKVSVTYGSKTLKNGKDYTVKYSAGRKDVGRYAVKVVFTGIYKGSKTCYFDIVPKSSPIVSVAAGYKSATVKWNRQSSQVTGYVLVYSTSSKFENSKSCIVRSKNTDSLTVSGLTNGRRVYFRLRTYKSVKIDGKNVNLWSKWSNIKSAIPDVNAKQLTVIVNKSSKVFHVSSSCSAVKRMSDKNKGTMKGTVKQIKSAGYKPCGICAKQYR